MIGARHDGTARLADGRSRKRDAAGSGSCSCRLYAVNTGQVDGPKKREEATDDAKGSGGEAKSKESHYLEYKSIINLSELGIRGCYSVPALRC